MSGAEKYATDLAAEEDCCTFKTARCQDWRRTPLVLETKSIVVPSKPHAGGFALQKASRSIGSWRNGKRSIEVGLCKKI